MIRYRDAWLSMGMRSKIMLIAVASAAFGLFGLAAWKGASSTVVAQGSTVLTLDGDKDNGRTLEIARGQQFTVDLQSQPGTGYDWTVADELPKILRLISSRNINVGPAMPGASGRKHFIFEVVGTGKASLRIVSRRSWEKDRLPIKTFSIVISAS